MPGGSGLRGQVLPRVGTVENAGGFSAEEPWKFSEGPDSGNKDRGDFGWENRGTVEEFAGPWENRGSFRGVTQVGTGDGTQDWSWRNRFDPGGDCREKIITGTDMQFRLEK